MATSTAQRAREAVKDAAASRWPVWFLLLSAVWGLSFVFIKEADQALSPLQVALARLTIGAVTLLILLGVQRESLPRGVRLWGHLAVLGVINNLLPFTLYAYAETQISSVLAGIWNAATPLFTVMVAMFVLPDERPTRGRLAGLLVGFIGVFVVLGAWRGLGGGSLILGSLAALAAAACYGLGFPYQRRFVSGAAESGASLAAGQLICASLEAGLVLLFFPHTPGPFNPAIVASVLTLGALGTGLAYVLSYAIVRAAGATTASTVTYLIPVFAVIAGVVLLRESITWNQPVGAAIILLGVALAQDRLPLRRAA